MNNKNLNLISLFSGAGGLDLGFIWSGFNVVWAIDHFEDAACTYRHNIGNHIVCGDIEDIDVNTLPDVDGIIGGFPCQGFSVANLKRSENDSRNKLYLQFIRFIRAKKPKFFIAENVKGILSLEKGKVFNQIINNFSKEGYNVTYSLLNAADYGVPQQRQRVFLFGVREDLMFEGSAFPPEPTHARSNLARKLKLSSWMSVGSALRDIPEPDEKHDLLNHDYSKYKLTFNGYLGHRKIDSEMPAPTITARGDEKGGVVILHHPNNHRRMSVRETAIVQSFPIDFYFCGRRTSAYRQIGNAVPPLLAKAVAEAVLKSNINLKDESDVFKSRRLPYTPSLFGEATF
jgi:DNA (cytosine-5)-methyltransferase 1